MSASDSTSTGSSSRADGLRVVMLNPWARFGVWTNRRTVLIDGLRQARPDLVTFVEAIKTDDYDQAVDLLGADYHVVHQTSRGGNGAGISIASRWPPAAVHEVDLHLTPRTAASFPCATLLVEVLAPAPLGPLLLVGSNPNWQVRFEYERELQAAATARAIENVVGQRELHVVVAGDFDAVPDTASMRFWRGLQSLDGMSVCYRDAWETANPNDPGHTFTPRNPLVANGETAWDVGRRIDYILVRCNDRGPSLDIAACARLFDEPVDGVWASDHFGVVADLTVRVHGNPGSTRMH